MYLWISIVPFLLLTKQFAWFCEITACLSSNFFLLMNYSRKINFSVRRWKLFWIFQEDLDSGCHRFLSFWFIFEKISTLFLKFLSIKSIGVVLSETKFFLETKFYWRPHSAQEELSKKQKRRETNALLRILMRRGRGKVRNSISTASLENSIVQSFIYLIISFLFISK